jgi:PAS domain S-box-containing protein
MSSQQECALSQPPKSSLGVSELLFRRLLRRRPHVTASLLASIVESSDDGIYSIDLDCIITSWNKGAEQLFGYTADEAVGRPVAMLIPLDRQDNEIAILERIKRGERICHYETVRQRKDGSLVEISLTVSPIYTAKGNIIGASKIARDISDRKKSQHFPSRSLSCGAISTPSRRTRPVCSARVESGQVTAAPPRSVMNSRRLITSSEARDKVS